MSMFNVASPGGGDMGAFGMRQNSFQKTGRPVPGFRGNSLFQGIMQGPQQAQQQYPMPIPPAPPPQYGFQAGSQSGMFTGQQIPRGRGGMIYQPY